MLSCALAADERHRAEAHRAAQLRYERAAAELKRAEADLRATAPLPEPRPCEQED